jgi:DNA-binding Lrp family transcriptional regulator
MATPEVLSRLRFLPGITQVADFQGPGIMAILWHDCRDVLPGLRKHIGRSVAWRLRASWTSPFPEPTVKMRTIDWRIVTSMRDDVRKDLRTVASLLRTTVRTVQRRLSALTEGKAVFVVGTPNVDRLAGLLCNYLVYCPDVNQKRRADATARQMFPRIGMCDTDPESYSVFGVSCENLSRAEESLARLRSLYRVDTVRLGIVREVFDVDEWIDGLLRKQGQTVPGLARRAHVN